MFSQLTSLSLKKKKNSLSHTMVENEFLRVDSRAVWVLPENSIAMQILRPNPRCTVSDTRILIFIIAPGAHFGLTTCFSLSFKNRIFLIFKKSLLLWPHWLTPQENWLTWLDSSSPDRQDLRPKGLHTQFPSAQEYRKSCFTAPFKVIYYTQVSQSKLCKSVDRHFFSGGGCIK